MHNNDLESTLRELENLINEIENKLVNDLDSEKNRQALLETKIKTYERKFRDYIELEKYELELYIPIGIKLERKWFRFSNLNPIGVAYTTLFKIELDQNLRGDFYKFVGIHEINHIKKIESFDEELNTIRSAFDYQLITGNSYTYLPK